MRTDHSIDLSYEEKEDGDHDQDYVKKFRASDKNEHIEQHQTRISRISESVAL